MAIRSTTGTGVVVALVVFIILSLALLATTIIFYSQKGKEMEEASNAESQLNKVASTTERNSEGFKALDSTSGQKTVYGYLSEQHKALQDYVGSPLEIDDLRQSYSDTLGVDTSSSLWTHMQNSRRQLDENMDTIGTLRARVSQLQEQNEDLNTRLQSAERERDVTLEANVDRQLQDINQADSKYEQQVATALDDLERAKERNRTGYLGQIQDLEREVDRLSDENVRGESRIQELQTLVNRSRIQPKDPANLVDGAVIEVAGRGDRVYIDRGKADQIVLGMTFEVYDDAAQIRPDAEGNFPRGKASIQVVKIGDTTSTAKVTRATRGRPVVSDDVIANAIYDPNYTFKFLVHGRFDVDGDGRATAEETDYLKRQVEAWGGMVLKEDRVTGDLDFLVLGVEPPNPLPPAANATERQIQDILELRMTHQQYQDLFEAAQKADIPVLNANRLYILTGQTGL
ncbi:MAG: hypothetical protein MK116_02525 [Phycisphaerales bacterium]|nr:hypothetical protein [Phycisphaerales bacterium]